MTVQQTPLQDDPSLANQSPTSRPLPITLIRPTKGWVPLNLGVLWEYRELLYFLVWRDVKIRYKQTVLGGAWAILQPFLTMVVFSIFFGSLAKVPSDGVPYPIFAYSGLIAWTYFANALTTASNSLVAQERTITKVYFPRLLIPISAVMAGLVDLAISFLVLIGMMLFYGIEPTPLVLLVPLFVLMTFATALGAGLWLAALNIEYRDIRYTLPFLIQFWLFATPIAYPSSLVPGTWRVVYGLNPMAGVVESFRWALLDKTHPAGMFLLVSIGSAVLLLVSGLYYFRRMERVFADVV